MAISCKVEGLLAALAAFYTQMALTARGQPRAGRETRRYRMPGRENGLTSPGGT